MKADKAKAEAVIYLDHIRPKKNGKCSVKIKITFNRQRKYFATKIELTPVEFEATMYAKRRTPEQKSVYKKLSGLLTKANNVIEDLSVFTFEGFEQLYFEQRNTRNSVSFAFDKYIEELEAEERISTAVSYKCAKHSIEGFKKGLTFAEITPQLLKKYQNVMLQEGKSISTVGIYLRSLRAIYNQQKINPDIYPFGDENKGKYFIPTSRNIKKALTIEEVATLYNYETKLGSTKDMAKDYWVFLYLCNGMNVKDFCLLTWENIDGDILTYNRAKTKRNKKEQKPIVVSLKAETLGIIKKWGQPSIVPNAYIFPHLNHKMSATEEYATYQQLTKTINKYIKQIATEAGINKNVTTYFARHSFATVLKRSGANTELIKELLGHSNVNVTESYLDSFMNEHIQQKTEVITAGFNKKKAG